MWDIDLIMKKERMSICYFSNIIFQYEHFYVIIDMSDSLQIHVIVLSSSLVFFIRRR